MITPCRFICPKSTRFPFSHGKKKLSGPENPAERPQSQERLITSNLRFVVSVAKKYQISGVSLLDLINEGNLAWSKPLRSSIIQKASISFPMRYGGSSSRSWKHSGKIQARPPAPEPRERTEKNRGQHASLSTNLNRLPSISEIAETWTWKRDVSHLLNLSQSHISIDSRSAMTTANLS